MVRTTMAYHWYMPLPRFLRLPSEQRRSILDVARHHFASHGPNTASYNKIIDDAGISKTTAYQYFDGRDDLLGAVLSDVQDRIAEMLGDWPPAPSEEAFWVQLKRVGAQLHHHLASTPDDLALVDAAADKAESDVMSPGAIWLERVIENGRDLGIVRDDTDPDLLLEATAAVLRSIDQWAIARLRINPKVSPSEHEQGYRLLAALWSEAR